MKSLGISISDKNNLQKNHFTENISPLKKWRKTLRKPVLYFFFQHPKDKISQELIKLLLEKQPIFFTKTK